MSPVSGHGNTKFYRKSTRAQNISVNLDDETARIFAAIDDNIQLSAIAQLADVSMPVLWRGIAKLTKLGLIEDGTGPTSTMEIQFADKLLIELTKAVGPISKVLIIRVLGPMNISWPHIPSNRAWELVNRISAQIPDEQTRNEFYQTILKELKEI